MENNSMDLKEYIGYRLSLSFNKKGILRYCGDVCFAHGIWCGIELDEAVGNTDGTVNNVTYFSCERNHGIFVQASEIINDLLFAKSDTEIVPLYSNECIPEFDFSTTPDVFSEISEDKGDEDKEDCKGKETFEILPEDINFDEHYESDDSLGILPSHLFDTIADDFIFDESEQIIEEIHKLHINETFDERSVAVTSEKNVSTQDIFSSGDKSNEGNSVIGNVTIDKYEITSHVLHEQENLNLTITVHDRITETDEFKITEEKKNSDELSSPVCIISKILQIPSNKLYGSPISTTPSSPQCASTPKPEGNSTFILDEVPSSAADFSPVSHMNKTIVKRDYSMLPNIFSQSEELNDINILSNTITLSSDTNESKDSEKNVLNVTCNITQLDNKQNELNKTFSDAKNDDKYLPVVKSYHGVSLNTTITFPEEHEMKDQKCEMKISSCYNEENIIQLDKMNQINVLNKTISLSEEVEHVNLEKLIDSNTEALSSFGETFFESAVSGCNIGTSLSKEVEKEENVIDLKKEHIHDETEKLNTTYEIKEKLSKLPKIGKTPIKSQKQPVMKHPENVKVSKIARRIQSIPSTTVASSSTCSELDKKKIRKSICIPSKSDNRGVLNKTNRRQTLGSLSETGESLRNPESPLKNIQKQHSTAQIISESKSLKTKSGTSLDNVLVPRGYSKKEKTDIKSGKKNQSFSGEVSLSSGFSAKETQDVKYVMEKNFTQSKVLTQDETVIPPSLMSDAENVVIKKKKQESSYKSMTSCSVKSSLAIQKEKDVKTQEKILRIPEKRVLVQKNEWRDVASATSVKQSLDKKTTMEMSKGLARSRIPAPVAKKEKIEEKSTQQMPEKKNAPRRSLR